MSERIQRSVRLSDVKTIRLVCTDRHEMTLEIPFYEMKESLQKLETDLCPVCNKEVWGASQAKKQAKNPYAHLVQSLLELSDCKYEKLEIEFVIPEKSSSAAWQ
jgi:hypothetical protein